MGFPSFRRTVRFEILPQQCRIRTPNITTAIVKGNPNVESGHFSLENVAIHRSSLNFFGKNTVPLWLSDSLCNWKRRRMETLMSTSTDDPMQKVSETIGGLAGAMTESGEHGEVVRLLMEHRGSLFAFILAVVRDYDAAEDVLQEVSVAVCEASDQFRVGTNFGAWAREIARRRILANNRAGARFPASMTDEDLRRLEAGFEKADSQASVKQRIGALRRCLDTLTDASRRILQLRFAGRFSHLEIAEQVDRKPESVRKAIYRARQALRTCIERRLHEVEGQA